MPHRKFLLMDLLHAHTISALSARIPGDPIHRCGTALLRRLTTDPDAVLRVADEKLRVFPFSEVDVCWRRLYTDASICLAVGMARKEVGTRKGAGDNGKTRDGSTGEWLDEVVRVLDRALIMTGGERREGLIEEIMKSLQTWAEETTDKVRMTKDTVGEKWPVEEYRAPDLLFPIRRAEMSLSTFEQHLRKSTTPVVITHALSHWPAMEAHRWRNPQYLLSKTFSGRRLVPVELGRSYTDDGWGQALMTFRQFCESYLLPASQGDNIAYLAQHDLFAQIPSLRSDICVPDFCYATPPPPQMGTPLAGKKVPRVEDPLLNAWFGPGGTISPLHTDPYHNVLCQVVGKKYVRLYAPEETERLYPRGVEAGGIDMSNTSRVDVEEVEMGGVEEESEFPLFRDAQYVETVLHEGECLYIPVGWWHYVRSLTVSFSVSFWWN